MSSLQTTIHLKLYSPKKNKKNKDQVGVLKFQRDVAMFGWYGWEK